MQDMLELFISRLQKVEGEFVEDFEKFLGTLDKGIVLAGDLSPKFQFMLKILSNHDFEVVNPEESMKSGKYYKQAFDRAVLSITEPLLGIAETGTIIETSDYNKIRSLSLVPENHLALLSPDLLAKDMQQALDQLTKRYTIDGSGEKKIVLPSAITFITGPSRTADIEQTLTVGVHGPIRMAVYIAE